MNRYASSAVSSCSRTRPVSPTIHRFAVSVTEVGSNASSGTQPFISANRAAFQSFVPKLRYPAIRSRLSFRSRPIAAIAVSVNRTASAPNSSISSIGSSTLPSDLDIFLPFSSRTRAWM